MSYILIEEGEAFCLRPSDLTAFLAARVAGSTVSVAEYGIGLGDFVADVTDLSPSDAARLLEGLLRPAAVQAA